MSEELPFPFDKVHQTLQARFNLPQAEARDVMVTFISIINKLKTPSDTSYAIGSAAFGQMLWTYFLHDKLYPLLEQAQTNSTPAGEKDWRHVAAMMGIQIFPFLDFWRRGLYLTQDQTKIMLQYQSKQTAGGSFYQVLQNFLSFPGQFCRESIQIIDPEVYDKLVDKRLSQTEKRLIFILKISDAHGGKVSYFYPTKSRTKPRVDPKLVPSIAAAVAAHQLPPAAGAAAIVEKTSDHDDINQTIEELIDLATRDRSPAVGELARQVTIQTVNVNHMPGNNSSSGNKVPTVNNHRPGNNSSSGNKVPTVNNHRPGNSSSDNNSVFYDASEDELPVTSAVSDVTTGVLTPTEAARQVLTPLGNSTPPSGRAVLEATSQIQKAAAAPPGTRRWKDAIDKLAGMATIESLKGATARLYESRHITGPVAATFLTAVAALGARKMTTQQKVDVEKLMTLAAREEKKGVSRSVGLGALGIGALGGLGAYGGYWLSKHQRQRQ